MKQAFLVIIIFLLFTEYTYSQKNINYGISVGYSLNYLRSPSQLWMKYDYVGDYSIGGNILYEPFEKNRIAFKWGVNFKRYDLMVNTEDLDPRHNLDKNIKYHLNYVGVNISTLYNNERGNMGGYLTYHLEPYLGQSSNYPDREIAWNYYQSIHQLLEVGYNLRFFHHLLLSLHVKGSLSPFGLSSPNIEFVEPEDKFLIYGGGMTLTYFFRRNKDKNN